MPDTLLTNETAEPSAVDDIQVTEALDKASVEKEERKSKRLRSLDALRGFDMFWIVGGSALVAALAKFTQWPWLERMAQEFQHAKWVGFTFYDLIFPLFLFLAGVAMPYSLGSKLEQGASKLRLTLKVFSACFYWSCWASSTMGAWHSNRWPRRVSAACWAS